MFDQDEKVQQVMELLAIADPGKELEVEELVDELFDDVEELNNIRAKFETALEDKEEEMVAKLQYLRLHLDDSTIQEKFDLDKDAYSRILQRTKIEQDQLPF